MIVIELEGLQRKVLKLKMDLKRSKQERQNATIKKLKQSAEDILVYIPLNLAY